MDTGITGKGREYTGMMYGFLEGLSDADEIKHCPFCGEEITTRYADGTAEKHILPENPARA